MTSAAADNYTEPVWEEAVAKPATATQERSFEWLKDKAGEDIEEHFKIDLENKKQASAFWAGYLMSWRFRMAFQASPENQKARATAAKATARAKDEDDDDEDEAPKKKTGKKAKKAEPEPEPAPKAKKGKAKRPEPVEDDDDDEEDEAPKAKAASKSSKGKRGKSAF